MIRYAKQRDKAEPGIVAALHAIGATVHRLESDSRSGVPDLLVGFAGVDGLLEVKNPAERTNPYRVKSGEVRHTARSPTDLSEAQETWHARWRGRPVKTVRTPAEAVSWVLSWRDRGPGLAA